MTYYLNDQTGYYGTRDAPLVRISDEVDSTDVYAFTPDAGASSQSTIGVMFGDDPHDREVDDSPTVKAVGFRTDPFFYDLSDFLASAGSESGEPHPGFPNGRRAGDDVGDAAPTAIGTSDGFEFRDGPANTSMQLPSLDLGLTSVIEGPDVPEEGVWDLGSSTTFAEDEVGPGDLSFGTGYADLIL